MVRARLMRGSLAAITLALPQPFWAQIGPMHGWWWDGWWPFGGLLASIGLFVIGLVFVLRWLLLERNPKSALPPGLAILEERYARGEFDREEYRQRRRDLGG